MMGVEPTSQPWQGCIIATIRHPHFANATHLLSVNYLLFLLKNFSNGLRLGIGDSEVPRARIELATQRFSVVCSTTELPRLVPLAVNFPNNSLVIKFQKVNVYPRRESNIWTA